MKILTVKMEEQTVTQLESYARDKKTTVSSVIRAATEEYLSNKRRNRLLDRAGDLVGCVEGPMDLSTNPKHLEGYGH